MNIITRQKIQCLLKLLETTPDFLFLINPFFLFPEWETSNIPGELIDELIYRIITFRVTNSKTAFGLTSPNAKFTRNSSGSYNLDFHTKSSTNVNFGDTFNQGKMVLWKDRNFPPQAGYPSNPFNFYPNGAVIATINFIDSSSIIQLRNVPKTQIDQYVRDQFLHSSTDQELTYKLVRDAEITVIG